VRSVRHAAESRSGVALVAALEELGWAHALSAHRRLAGTVGARQQHAPWGPGAGVMHGVQDDAVYRTLRGIINCRTTLLAGFTTARNLGLWPRRAATCSTCR